MLFCKQKSLRDYLFNNSIQMLLLQIGMLGSSYRISKYKKLENLNKFTAT